MKVGSRLAKSLESLANDVLAENEPIIVVERLHDWYQQYLSGILHHAHVDTSVVDWFVATDNEELPVTIQSIGPILAHPRKVN